MLVYFHGGEFKYGGKDLYKPDYLYDSIMSQGQEMIVVTVNYRYEILGPSYLHNFCTTYDFDIYRLGVFGFLSTDDINQPGNNGIRDQLLALQWVNQNIGLFQGNPNQVTIMGHDAGGVSVGMHLLNQDAVSKLLFVESKIFKYLTLNFPICRVLPFSHLHQWYRFQSLGI